MQQNPGDPGADQTMHEELMHGIEGADEDVECNPCKRQPACPILTAQHENSGDDGQNLGEGGPKTVVLQCDDFVEMVGEAHDADRDVDGSKNRDRNGAWIRGHGRFSGVSLTISNVWSGRYVKKKGIEGISRSRLSSRESSHAKVETATEISGTVDCGVDCGLESDHAGADMGGCPVEKAEVKGSRQTFIFNFQYST